MSSFGKYNNPYGCTFNNDSWKSGYSSGTTGSSGSLDAWREARGYSTGSASSASSASAGGAGSASSLTGMMGDRVYGGASSRGSLSSEYGYEDEYSDYDSLQKQNDYYRQQAENCGAYVPGNPYSNDPSKPNDPSVTPSSTMPSGNEQNTYTVKSGDSLWKIAKKLHPGASNSELQQFVNDLVQKNNIKDPNKIYPGRKIKY